MLTIVIVALGQAEKFYTTIRLRSYHDFWLGAYISFNSHRELQYLLRESIDWSSILR